MSGRRFRAYSEILFGNRYAICPTNWGYANKVRGNDVEGISGSYTEDAQVARNRTIHTHVHLFEAGNADRHLRRALVGMERSNCFCHIRDLGQDRVFQLRRVCDECIKRADPPDGCIQMLEEFVGNPRGYLSSVAE